MTEWRAIKGFETSYEVSDNGDVRRVDRGTPSPLRGHIINTGYRLFDLYDGKGCRTRVLAHRLVCAAWHGEQPEGRPEVDHLDGNRMNNDWRNLRWASKLENEENKRLRGCHLFGERHGAAKLTEAQALAIINDDRPQRRVAAAFNISQATVSQIKCGYSWPHLARGIDDETKAPATREIRRRGAAIEQAAGVYGLDRTHSEGGL